MPPKEDISYFSSNPVLRHFWHPVAQSEDIEAGPLARTVLGTPIVVFRDSAGNPACLPDICPHRQAAMSRGTVTAGRIACPYHGWEFDGTGRCMRVPSAGPDDVIPTSAHIQPYHARERYGLVWVALADPVADLPASPYDDDPRYRRLNTPVDVWQVSCSRLVDNLMDISHFPYTHPATLGVGSEKVVPPYSMQMLPDGFCGYIYEVRSSNPEIAHTASGQSSDVVERRMTTGYALPFAVRSTVAYSSGLEHNLYLLSTPIDDVSCYFTFIVWRNDDGSIPPEDVLAFDHAIAAEDKRQMEAIAGPLPLVSGLVSVAADRASLAWRRDFRSLLEKGIGHMTASQLTAGVK
ncbi:aromatic ring-hydroxylating dioxygenase subunit alpha [Streptomyces sp. NPDC051172]|uniref:aromatic ring-hydroxylating dioxygenase subunit alpha n=1 Tax=Streptomyces sp. NPDC051172 TaxID=3155796 RepID=UPI0034310620